MHYLSVEEIINSTNRIPYDLNEFATIKNFVLKEQKNGLDVSLHAEISADGSPEGALETLQRGILIVACPQIQSDVVFVKCDDGRGFFGGQKTRFHNYLGSVAEDNFLVGSTSKHLLLGLTGINNIFRAQGVLKGGAF